MALLAEGLAKNSTIQILNLKVSCTCEQDSPPTCWLIRAFVRTMAVERHPTRGRQVARHRAQQQHRSQGAVPRCTAWRVTTTRTAEQLVAMLYEVLTRGIGALVQNNSIGDMGADALLKSFSGHLNLHTVSVYVRARTPCSMLQCANGVTVASARLGQWTLARGGLELHTSAAAVVGAIARLPVRWLPPHGALADDHQSLGHRVCVARTAERAHVLALWRAYWSLVAERSFRRLPTGAA